MQEVSGSIPLTSTSKKQLQYRCGGRQQQFRLQEAGQIFVPIV
jgi:hypothetical protein